MNSCAGTQLAQEDCNPSQSRISETDFLEDKFGRPITWSSASLPIPVVVSSSFDQFETMTILQGIEYWNRLVGQQIFYPALGPSNEPEFGSGEIVITRHDLPVSCKRQILGLTTWRMDHSSIEGQTNITTAHVELYSEHVHDKSYLRTVVHELGHTLGLRHDEDTYSVMYPSILDGEWYVEQEDLEIIRRAAEKFHIP